MSEDVFLKEKDQTKSEYSKYRDIIVEIINENETLPASVIFDRLKERVGTGSPCVDEFVLPILKRLKATDGAIRQKDFRSVDGRRNADV